MTRVIHTGDTHIGYRQYHSPERRADFLDAFERVVADAVDADPDAVVHAGDLFHDRRPDLPDLLGVLSALRTLDDAGIPFLAVVGNHESTRGGQWLDLFESMGLATRLDDEPTVIGDTAFYGLDHAPESRRDALEYEFAPHDAEVAALVSHGLFEPFPYADWDTGEVLRESTVDFDAVLLGDNHTPDTAQVEDAWVTYCGSTERASADERDPRGYNLVRLGADADDGDDPVDIRRRTLETRPFVFLDVELGEGEGLDRVRDRVRERDVADAVVIVRITGDGEAIAPAAVEEFAAERGALIARVTDRREVEAETELSVSFADPDEAVRERIGDLGLSEVAREVDNVVRGDLPDSNVREEVTRRIEARFDGEDAAGDGADTDDEGDGDADEGGDGGADEDDGADDDADGGSGEVPTGSGDDGQLTLGDSR